MARVTLVATIQMIIALNLEHGYDRSIFRALVVGALYPVAYWLISATAAMHSEVVALVRGPSDRPVVWNIPREHMDGQRPGEANQRKPQPDGERMTGALLARLCKRGVSAGRRHMNVYRLSARAGSARPRVPPLLSSTRSSAGEVVARARVLRLRQIGARIGLIARSFVLLFFA